MENIYEDEKQIVVTLIQYLMEERMKRHYKMYKSGKQWCLMFLSALTLGVGLLSTNVHADSVNDSANSTVTTQVVNQKKDDTTQAVTSSQTADDQNQIKIQTNCSAPEAADQNRTVLDTVNNKQTNIESNNGTNINTNLADSQVEVRAAQQPTVQNGWITNDSGQKLYYRNGHLDSGREYVNLPSMTDANSTNYYLLQDGIAQSGLQEWMGSHYYFDPQTFLVVKNTYVDPDGNDSGYLLGRDGIALNGIQKWQGTYYAFDYNTYRLVKNQKFREWGYTYQIDNSGRVVSGLYRDNNGDVYYYNPSSYLAETNTYVVPSGTKNGYLLGNDGRALSGVQKWQGTYYYFDPTTKQLVRNNYVKSQWGLWYMVGSNGALVTGAYRWQGSVYFFDPSSYLRVDNDYRVPAGQTKGYLLGSDGRALSGVQKWQGTYYYFDPSTYLLSGENYVQSQWGLWYMVGTNGALVTGPYRWQGTWYYFDPSSYLLARNSTERIGGASYYTNADGVITSVVNDAPAISQRPELPTGCEMTAVTMMLQYAGVKISKTQVANETPRSSNPYYGFVGNPYGTSGYGLWVAPSGIASVVQKNLGRSWNMTGCSLSAIQSQLINRHLVVVWQAHMHGFGTHAITLTGFNNSGFYYNDPWTGEKNAFMTYRTFDYNWRDDPASRGALSY